MVESGLNIRTDRRIEFSGHLLSSRRRFSPEKSIMVEFEFFKKLSYGLVYILIASSIFLISEIILKGKVRPDCHPFRVRPIPERNLTLVVERRIGFNMVSLNIMLVNSREGRNTIHRL